MTERNMATITTAGTDHPKVITITMSTDEHTAMLEALTKEWPGDETTTIFTEANPTEPDGDTFTITLPGAAVGRFAALAQTVGGGFTDVADAITQLGQEAMEAALTPTP